MSETAARSGRAEVAWSKKLVVVAARDAYADAARRIAAATSAEWAVVRDDDGHLYAFTKTEFERPAERRTTVERGSTVGEALRLGAAQRSTPTRSATVLPPIDRAGRTRLRHPAIDRYVRIGAHGKPVAVADAAPVHGGAGRAVAGAVPNAGHEPPLAPAELRLYAHLRKGLSVREIAGAMDATVLDVNAHFRSLHRKVDSHDPAEAATLAKLFFESAQAMRSTLPGDPRNLRRPSAGGAMGGPSWGGRRQAFDFGDGAGPIVPEDIEASILRRTPAARPASAEPPTVPSPTAVPPPVRTPSTRGARAEPPAQRPDEPRAPPAPTREGPQAQRPQPAPALLRHDEGTAPLRYPSIESKKPLQPNVANVFIVDLRTERSASTAGGAVPFGPLAGDWQSIDLDVVLTSSNVEFAKGGRGKLTVRRNAATIAAEIGGTVDAGVAPGTSVDVGAQFYRGTRFCGMALRSFVVGAPGESAEGTRATDETSAAKDALGSVVVDLQAPPPDVTVHISVDDKTKPGDLVWQVVTPRFAGLPPKLRGTCSLGADPASEARALYAQFAVLVPGRHRTPLEGFGEQLWKRTPESFRAAYWAICDHHKRRLSIQFITDEPHMPWELMRPVRADGSEAHAPLAIQHAVGRWIADYDGQLSNRIPAGGLATIAPHYKSVSRLLARAEAESLEIEKRYRATRVPGKYDAVRSLLETSPPKSKIALLHFAGHGKFAAGAVGGSSIELEDGPLLVDEVARREVTLGSTCRTLVVFNACEVGASGSALGAVGGWANAFLGREFGGFIAPLWSVEDEDAAAVTFELIEGIVERGEPIGEVLRGIRERHGNTSPTFFSYLYYGDVNARLVAA